MLTKFTYNFYLKLLLYAFFAFSFSISLYLIYNYYNQKKLLFNKVQSFATNFIDHEKLNSKLFNLKANLSKKELKSKLKLILKQNKDNFFQNEVFSKEYLDLYKNLVLIIIVLMISFLLLMLIITKAHNGQNIWVCSWLTTLILVIAIAFLWYLQIYKYNPVIKDSIIYDIDSAENIIKQHAKNTNNVLTGVFIRHINFEKLKEVNLLGTLWQKYSQDNIKDNIKDKSKKDLSTLGKIDFTFPDVGDLTKTIIIDKVKNNTLIKSWDFSAKLQQDFNYSDYPFDYKHIKLHIKPLASDQNIALIPDLNSYMVINPASLPGIDSKEKLYGWSLHKSYFSYESNNKITKKMSDYLGEDNIPQLCFNIILERSFLHSFISNILPLLLALIFLFFILRSVLVAQIKRPITTSILLSPLGMVTSLFFAIILSHISLRNTLSGQQLFYLEYFYIIAYFIMFSYLLIIFFILTGKKFKFIEYKNGILPQALYFPVLLILSFIATASFFYN